MTHRVVVKLSRLTVFCGEKLKTVRDVHGHLLSTAFQSPRSVWCRKATLEAQTQREVLSNSVCELALRAPSKERTAAEATRLGAPSILKRKRIIVRHRA